MASVRRKSGVPEPQPICARLSQLNPEVGRLFQLKEDVLACLDLRMVLTNTTKPMKSPVVQPLETPASVSTTRRTAALPVAVNPKVSSYIVVSYAWHNLDWQLAAAATPIASGWGISRPMVDAVLACRDNDGEGVWIDKLCINQDDEHDRKTHVGAMDVIYRSARRMVILLEDVQLDEDEAFAALLYKQWYQDMCVAVTENSLEGAAKNEFVKSFVPSRDYEYYKRERLATESKDQGPSSSNISFARLVAGRRRFIVKILKVRWFSRAWCAHESRVRPHEQGGDPLMLCFGPDGVVLSFGFRFMHWLPPQIADTSSVAGPMLSIILGGTKASRVLVKAAIRDEGRSQLGFEVLGQVAEMTRDSDPAELERLWDDIAKMHPEPAADCSLLQHLISIIPFRCSFTGDLVSIALNTSSVPLAFIGKADTIDEAMWIFSLLMLAANDAVPLVVDGSRRRLPGGVRSWLRSATKGLLPGVLHIPDPSVISSVTMEYIELDLLVFRTIPVAPSSSSLEKAKALVRKFKLKKRAREYARKSNHDNDGHRLAYCILAMDVLRRGTTPKPMDVFIETWLAHGIDCGPLWMARFPETLRRATKDGFHTYGMTGVATDNKLDSAAWALSAMTMTPPTAAHTQRRTAGQDNDNIHELSCFLRTVLDPRLKYFVTQPRRLAVDADDHAIVGQTTNISYIAVPLALALAQTPAIENRAWVIEPFDPATENHYPERVEDYLPDPARARIEPGEKVEDVYPLLTSDFEDRRRPRDDGRATWRMRKACEIFGCQDFGPIISRLATAAAAEGGIRDEGSDNIMLLRKQKVYGAELHPWNEVYAATQRIEGGLGDCPIGKVVGRAGTRKEEGFNKWSSSTTLGH